MRKIRFSGQSPFLGSSNDCTCRNILEGEVSYPVQHFGHVTQEAADLSHILLNVDPKKRPSLNDVRNHSWFHMVSTKDAVISK